MITEDYVRKIFKGLEQGDGASFFEHVDDKVDWIIEGTHPLAGHYKSKSDFLAGSFAKLDKVLPHGAQLVLEHLLVKDDWAVVELHSLATAKNGLRFDNRYCWVCHFDGDTIDQVRAYLDSAMVARGYVRAARADVVPAVVHIVAVGRDDRGIASDRWAAGGLQRGGANPIPIVFNASAIWAEPGSGDVEGEYE